MGVTAGVLLGLVVVCGAALVVTMHRASVRTARLRTENKALTDELLETTRRLEELVRQDPLSGIPNRRHFDESLEREWERAMRQQTALAVLVMELDHFKEYNDGHGHGPGDQCLRRVAQELHGTLRSGTDVVCRYGGEEFAAILAGSTLEQAMGAAERLRKQVRALAIPHGRSVAPVVTLSIGAAAVIPTPALRAEDLVAAADRGLYAAKRMGRDRVDTSSVAGTSTAA